MTPVKRYSFTVPAFGSYTLQVVGSYFVILASTGPVQVNGDLFGTVDALVAGQGIEDQPFNVLQFNDTTGAANNVQVLVAGQHFINQRVVGEVSVIDGEKARTLAGGMFSAALSVSASAGQFSRGQIWNTSTTKNLIVTQLTPFVGAAGQLIVLHATVQAAGGALGGQGANKMSGGPAPTAQMRFELTAAGPVVTANNTLASWTIGANLPILWPIKGAIVIAPGKGLDVWGNTANMLVGANVEWFEELVP